MHFGILESLLSDPATTLTYLLLALPGRLLAITLHEVAHAWVADRCGDPTAKLAGRITLNPLKHLDPIGILMMLLLGIGWAKPVPVNPLHYRNYRKDDLKVSLAGIAMNLFLFVFGYFLMAGVMTWTLSKIPYRAVYWKASDTIFRSTYKGASTIFLATESGYKYGALKDLIGGLYNMVLCIKPVFGNIAGYLYQMLYYFTVTNLLLAIFNLIPVPPLDGYHVLNDLILKRPLFADFKAQRIGQAALLIASFSGILSSLLEKVYTFVLSGMGSGLIVLLQGLNIL